MNLSDHDLAAALTSMASDDVAELVASARRDGLRLAHDRLVEAYAEALLRAVARGGPSTASTDVTGLRPSAPPTPAETGCYVYAVVAGDGTGADGGGAGVQPGGPVGVVTAGDISAVVSEVDLAAMREGGSHADIDEGGWLANAVRAHERVVLAAFHSAPTVPMRFGIVHADRGAVQRLLVDYADSFRAELQRIAGAAEWQVKVYADVDVVARQASDGSVSPEADPAASASVAGRSYLLRERERRAVSERVRQLIAAHVDRLAEHLAAAARDTVVTSSVVAADPAAPVFSAAYLVDRSDESRLVSVVEAVAGEVDRHGLSVELNGPWPPYHFTTLRLEPRSA